jgi:hypothetical protein
MQLSGFDELLTDVRALEENLREPAPMFARHRADYWRQARRVAAEVLRLLRPPEIKAPEWQAKVERIVDRVTTDLLAGANGIVFSIGDGTRFVDGSLAPNESRPASQVMSYEDIKEWIRAGIAGEPGGKRITAIDEDVMSEKGIPGVAAIVMKAYYSKKPEARYTRLRAAIQRYFLGARKTEAEPLLDAIAVAWVEHFTPVIARDLGEYADGLCRKF